MLAFLTEMLPVIVQDKAKNTSEIKESVFPFHPYHCPIGMEL